MHLRRESPGTLCGAQAYADYNDVMVLTEELVSGLVKEVTGSYTIQYHADGPDAAPTTIDFSPPWVRPQFFPHSRGDLRQIQQLACGGVASQAAAAGSTGICC